VTLQGQGHDPNTLRVQSNVLKTVGDPIVQQSLITIVCRETVWSAILATA